MTTEETIQKFLEYLDSLGKTICVYEKGFPTDGSWVKGRYIKRSDTTIQQFLDTIGEEVSTIDRKSAYSTKVELMVDNDLAEKAKTLAKSKKQSMSYVVNAALKQLFAEKK